MTVTCSPAGLHDTLKYQSFTIKQMDSIKTLFDWSSNFEVSKNPYCLFLDLIGYSDAQYGMRCYTGDNLHEHLGYKEMCMLGDALKAFETNGYEAVYDYCNELEV
ncbi:hypothetical protein PRUG_00009 [Prochlorococcus phage P-SSP6]|uniref:Uncharacterized protein n=2 Tax=Tangaroavirus tv951510a TaxID=2733962 RepID=M1NXF0_9CAUD|nr:hypothetical protein CYOG_00013 [Cyanophage 9515-10a]ADP00034.1 predicted protein [Cyanophage 9515-10a]AGF91566.1 hypothetical protein PRUG_00009 [Prochlorococcus phage P-SSP6]